MKKKTGRPRKNAIGNLPFFARVVARDLREALRLTQEVGGIDDEIPEFETKWNQAEKAWAELGVWICECCDPDNPARFLRRVADELDGKLIHSSTDKNLWDAYWDSASDGGLVTLSKLKKKLQEMLAKDASLPADFSLRRSIERLGLVLHKEEEIKQRGTETQ